LIAAILAVSVGLNLQLFPPQLTRQDARSTTLIARENAHQGTADWLKAFITSPSEAIQAYASAISVHPGQTLTFYVSTEKKGTPYSAAIYRLGWYGGTGARLLKVVKVAGQAQGYYDQATKTLVGCTTCRFDAGTRMTEADWRPSFTVTVPADWVTGVYFVGFTDKQDQHTFLTFDVTGNTAATYVVVTADTTVEAYNSWGGSSLYQGADSKTQDRAYAVSFDRPVAGAGFEQGIVWEIDAIRWLEREGYNLSYISSTDLDEDPGILLQHRAVLVLGHDEYWSGSMRVAYLGARAAGVGLAFLGADDGFWQIRFAADSRGAKDRTIICYKLAQADPLYGKDNALVTVNWRNPPLSEPENSLIGIMYSSFSGPDIATGHRHAPWSIDPEAASSPLLRNTGLVASRTYGCDYVGYEWDRVFANSSRPPGLHVIATSPIVQYDGTPDEANSTYYVASSGSFVFASGSVLWTYGLDNLRLLVTPGCENKSFASSGIEHMMANIMASLVAGSPVAVSGE
jgi:hypothetical protein